MSLTAYGADPAPNGLPGRTLERWQLMSILSKREESTSPAALEMRVARLR